VSWRALALVGAVIGLIVSLTIALTSYLPFVGPAPEPLLVVCFLGLFPTFGGAVIRGVVAQRRQGTATPKLTTFRWPREATWIAVLVVFAAISFFSAMAVLPGQPEKHGGGYYFNNHGSLEPTSRAGYQRGLRAQERIFSAMPALFYGVAAVLWRSKGDEDG
jgi:hypothetical protein